MIKLFLGFLFIIFNNILMAQTDTLKSFIPSVFSGHSLKPLHNTPILINSNYIYWPSIILFLVFSVYVYIKIADPKKIAKIFISIFSLQTSKQLLREDYKLNKRVSIFLSFSFILIISFLVYLTNDYFGLILQNFNPVYQYLFFILSTTCVFFVKILVVLSLSFITSTAEIGKEYIFNVFLFCQVLGIISFPFVVLMQFSRYPKEWFLYPILIICGCLYSLRLYRGLTISVLEQSVGFLYIILYLCALEILPFLILVKILLTNF